MLWLGLISACSIHIWHLSFTQGSLIVSALMQADLVASAGIMDTLPTATLSDYSSDATDAVPCAVWL